jgi:hypothetical protein
MGRSGSVGRRHSTGATQHGFRRLIRDIDERDAYRAPVSGMITKKQAEQIASVAINRIPAFSGARVRTVVAWSQIPWRPPYVYNARAGIEESWVAYLEFPDEPLMLRSSRVIVISQTDGSVLFAGDACDEG